MRQPSRHRGSRAPAIAGLLAAILLAGPASGEEVAEMKPIREAFPQKTQGCFVRRYDAGHLKANPQQSIATIRLARLAPERKREDLDGPEAPAIGLRLLLTTRLGTSPAEAMDCEAVTPPGDQATVAYLWCRSTCNRGRVDVTPLGPDRVRITIGGLVGGRFVPDAIGVGKSCSSDAGIVWLGDREGDRSFILDRAKLGACR